MDVAQHTAGDCLQDRVEHPPAAETPATLWQGMLAFRSRRALTARARKMASTTGLRCRQTAKVTRVYRPLRSILLGSIWTERTCPVSKFTEQEN
jgi:hypothetical protein